jgi:hypothetical protein
MISVQPLSEAACAPAFSQAIAAAANVQLVQRCPSFRSDTRTPSIRDEKSLFGQMLFRYGKVGQVGQVHQEHTLPPSNPRSVSNHQAWTELRRAGAAAVWPGARTDCCMSGAGHTPPRSLAGRGEHRDLRTVSRRCSMCEQIRDALSKRRARIHGVIWLCQRCESACEARGWLLQ